MELFSISLGIIIKSLASTLLQGSVECRLLTSVFYEFGKFVSAQCPFYVKEDAQLANGYFIKAFQEFILLFPNLRLNDEEFASTKIESESYSYSYLAFARLNARNGFKQRNASPV